jgi:hypothetical protein
MLSMCCPPRHRPGEGKLMLPPWHRPGKVEQMLPPWHRPGEVEQVLPAWHRHRPTRLSRCYRRGQARQCRDGIGLFWIVLCHRAEPGVAELHIYRLMAAYIEGWPGLRAKSIDLAQRSFRTFWEAYPIAEHKTSYPSKTLCLTRVSEGSRRTGKLKINTISTLRERKAEDSPQGGQKGSMQGIEPSGHPRDGPGKAKGVPLPNA